MANNAAYWKKRFEYLEASQNRKGLECYAEIEQHYRKAEKQIEQEIRSWYQRFADNNEITLSEARKMLTSKELAEFKWDVNEYIKYGQENALNGQWTKQLENASARYHISRLESLEMQMQQQVEVLFGNQLDALDATMRDVYTNGYYHTAFEIQKGIGVGWDFAKLDTKTINKVINKPWAVDGKNFSARVWDDREKLVNEINQTLVQNIVLGQDPQKAIDAIAHRLDVSKSNAGRLVMTEEAYFSSESQHDCFKELDVEQFEVVETLDHTTCDTCAEMDGKVFPMSQWEVGVTVPPFHPWCRGTTVPAFGDEFDKLGERAARDEEGNYYTVPGNCTYKQWEKAFVQGDKSVLQEIEKNAKIDSKSTITPDALHPATIGGATLGKPMSFKEADTYQVNPNYGTKNGYSINCQSCVVTFEARQRGYDVQVLANTRGSMCETLSHNTRLAWIDPATGKPPEFIVDKKATTPKKALAFLNDTVKQGERYTMQVSWKGRSRSGHIVNLDRNEEGKLRIKDNQRGKNETSEWIGDDAVLGYLQRLKYTGSISGYKYYDGPMLTRIDNMAFNEDVVNKIMKGNE